MIEIRFSGKGRRLPLSKDGWNSENAGDPNEFNPDSVLVTKIVLIDLFPMWYDHSYVIQVYHDGPWYIYRDTKFEEGISKLLSEKIGSKITTIFTGQGGQKDGVAEMEARNFVSDRQLHRYIKYKDKKVSRS